MTASGKLVPANLGGLHGVRFRYILALARAGIVASLVGITASATCMTQQQVVLYLRVVYGIKDVHWRIANDLSNVKNPILIFKPKIFLQTKPCA
jgi:hypothetical protein